MREMIGSFQAITMRVPRPRKASSSEGGSGVCFFLTWNRDNG